MNAAQITDMLLMADALDNVITIEWPIDLDHYSDQWYWLKNKIEEAIKEQV